MKKVSLILMSLILGGTLLFISPQNTAAAPTGKANSAQAANARKSGSGGNEAIGTIEGAATIKGVEALDNPEQALADTVTFILNIVFGIAVLLVLANLIWGAYLWIMSGGDSGKLQAARSRMIFSVVGLLILVLSYPIAKLVQDILISPDQNQSIIRLE